VPPREEPGGSPESEERLVPWKVFAEGNLHCVHKLKPDGTRGEKVACHPTRERAMRQMAVLYMSEKEAQQRGQA
jgi:hypothetical protein